MVKFPSLSDVLSRCFLFAAVVVFNAAACSAVTISFDFGSAAPANVVVADNAPVGTVTETVGGVTITLDPVIAAGADASTSMWGANAGGFGVRSFDAGGGGSVDPGANGSIKRRISGDVGEAIEFSFDTDVTLESLLLGSLGSGETAVISLVSGTDPFGGSGVFEIDGPVDATSDISVGAAVQAGTVLSISTVNGTTTAGGILFNELTVSIVPEPGSLALLSLGVTALMGMGRRRTRSSRPSA